MLYTCYRTDTSDLTAKKYFITLKAESWKHKIQHPENKSK